MKKRKKTTSIVIAMLTHESQSLLLIRRPVNRRKFQCDRILTIPWCYLLQDLVTLCSSRKDVAVYIGFNPAVTLFSSYTICGDSLTDFI